MSIYNHEIQKANGEVTTLENYKGQTLLIVNTASKSGFTKQYDGLEKLHEEFSTKGFSVLAFPCNQFGGQESGSNEEIQSFCTMNFGIKFPVFAKIEVNGSNTHPLFKDLKDNAPGILGTKKIKWNFTKFLVGPDGKVIKRYAPTTKPEDIVKDLKQIIK